MAAAAPTYFYPPAQFPGMQQVLPYTIPPAMQPSRRKRWNNGNGAAVVPLTRLNVLSVISSSLTGKNPAPGANPLVRGGGPGAGITKLLIRFCIKILLTRTGRPASIPPLRQGRLFSLVPAWMLRLPPMLPLTNSISKLLTFPLRSATFRRSLEPRDSSLRQRSNATCLENNGYTRGPPTFTSKRWMTRSNAPLSTRTNFSKRPRCSMFRPRRRTSRQGLRGRRRRRHTRTSRCLKPAERPSTRRRSSPTRWPPIPPPYQPRSPRHACKWTSICCSGRGGMITPRSNLLLRCCAGDSASSPPRKPSSLASSLLRPRLLLRPPVVRPLRVALPQLLPPPPLLATTLPPWRPRRILCAGRKQCPA